jgi:hypothetical protein
VTVGRSDAQVDRPERTEIADAVSQVHVVGGEDRLGTRRRPVRARRTQLLDVKGGAVVACGWAVSGTRRSRGGRLEPGNRSFPRTPRQERGFRVW